MKSSVQIQKCILNISLSIHNVKHDYCESCKSPVYVVFQQWVTAVFFPIFELSIIWLDQPNGIVWLDQPNGIVWLDQPNGIVKIETFDIDLQYFLPEGISENYN